MQDEATAGEAADRARRGGATGVTEAVTGRRSVRAFLPEEVPETVLRRVLTTAARAPSGGNLQPWHVVVLTGARLAALVERVAARAAAQPRGEAAEYPIYPSPMAEPYRSRRFAVGEAMYARLGIPREDRAARRAWFARNYRLFGAPVGLFCFVDRAMGAAQFADLGMFLQSVMLLLREAGYDSCPQEAWAMFAPTVYEVLATPPERMLFCGMAIGRADPDAAVNGLRSARAPLEEFARFEGFDAAGDAGD